MNELSPNTRIELEDGSYVSVVKLLGEGGQGQVYLVRDSAGKDFALKWYTDRNIIKDEKFRDNLKHNVKQGKPTPSFLWPMKVTKRQKPLGNDESYGYIMDLRPKGFHEMGEMACIDKHPDSYFKSTEAKLNAAIQICDGFRNLHLHGYSYQDMNEGGFFIDFNTGNVLICDNDNVVANGNNLGVKGKVRYMAPEVVEGGAPNILSDSLSLAIILYRIFMVDHPLEGAFTLKYPDLTPEIERGLFGKHAVFCYDATDTSNRPVPGIDINSIKYWRLISPSLRAMFQRALGKEALHNPANRVRVREWKEFLLKLRRNLVVCPAEGRNKPDFQFMADTLPTVCPKCRKNIKPTAQLAFADKTVYDFYRHKHLYIRDSTTPIAYGVSRRKDDGTEEFAIRNLSPNTWTLITASKRTVMVAPNMAVPLRTGMEIVFDSNNSCKVTLS